MYLTLGHLGKPRPGVRARSNIPACLACRSRKVYLIYYPLFFIYFFISFSNGRLTYQLKCTHEKPSCRRCDANGVPCCYPPQRSRRRTKLSTQSDDMLPVVDETSDKRHTLTSTSTSPTPHSSSSSTPSMSSPDAIPIIQPNSNDHSTWMDEWSWQPLITEGNNATLPMSLSPSPTPSSTPPMTVLLDDIDASQLSSPSSDFQYLNGPCLCESILAQLQLASRLHVHLIYTPHNNYKLLSEALPVANSSATVKYASP